MLEASNQPSDEIGQLDAIIASAPSKKSARKAEGGARSKSRSEQDSPRPKGSRRKVAKPQAIAIPQSNAVAPAAQHSDLPGAVSSASSMNAAPPEDRSEIPEARRTTPTISHSSRETPLPGQYGDDDQHIDARQNRSAASRADDGHHVCDIHFSSALVGEITVHHRRYEDIRKARQKLELQAMATCRSVCGGDKVAGQKLYNEPTPEVLPWLMPYLAAMEPLDAAIADQAKLLDKMGKRLPVIDWCDGIAGLSPRFLAMIVGECGIGPGEFPNPGKLWKRMGMGVIKGRAQRRVSGDEAIEQGYVPRRRSLMWNIGNSLMKQQIRSEKDENGKKIEGSEYAIGELGQLYLTRKAYLRAKNEAGDYAERPGAKDGKLPPYRIAADTKRYMEKRLLRELWRAWRRGHCGIDNLPPAAPSPTELSGGAAIYTPPNTASPHPEEYGLAAVNGPLSAD